MNELPEHEVVAQIISEIVGLEPRVKAIACVMILDDGSATIRTAFTEGTKITLLGGAALLMSDCEEDVRRTQPPRNYEFVRK